MNHSDPEQRSSTQPDDSWLAALVSNLARQWRKLFPLILLLNVPLLFGMAALVVVYLRTDIPIRYFFIDPVAEFNAPMYIGLLSNFGVLVWCATATVCLFGAWLLFPDRKKREVAWFLIASGLITAVLMLDDLYLLHEEVLPDHLHVPQKLVFAGYAAMMLGFLVRFRRAILDTDFLLLLLSLGFFGLSVLIDVFIEPETFYIAGHIPGRHLIEDGFKLLGIVGWAGYFIRTVVQKVERVCRPA